MATSSGGATGRLRVFASAGARVVLDACFPPRCPGCGRRGTWLCDGCAAAAPRVGWPRCSRCGQPTTSRCLCHEVGPALDLAHSALWYEGWVPAAIHWFKYQGDAARAGMLGHYLEAECVVLPPIDAVAAVPLHARREGQRGYNQAELLAKRVAAASAVPCERPLMRNRNTPRQVGLHADERAVNIAGAFAVRPGAEIAGRRWLLVDDVMTTSATLGECAEVLKRAGAGWVGALTLARER